MNKNSIIVGKIDGIPVRIDYSWFLILALVTWSLATNYFPTEYKNWPVVTYWLTGLVTALLFLGSVFFHELAHSLVARRFNVPVRRITLYIFGGISELEKEPTTAAAEFWISISGPLTNIILGGVSVLLAVVFSPLAPVQASLKYLAYINFILGVTNLLPGYPLDGGSVLMAIVWAITRKRHWGVMAATVTGNLIAYSLILVGTLEVSNGDLWNGLWIVFTGWFLLSAAGGEMRREQLQAQLSGHRVAEAMDNNYTTIHPDTTLQTLMDEHILSNGQRYFIVKQDDRLVGMVTLHALQSVPKWDWPKTTVGQVMIPLSSLITTQPDSDLFEATEEMDRDGVNQLPVVETGQIQGILSRADVISYLRKVQTT